MTERRILNHSAHKTDIAHIDEDGTVHIEQVERCDPVLARVAALTEAQPDRHDGMRLEAVIPAHVMRRAYVEGWFHDEARWRRWANDPANRAFRVEHQGRVKTL